MYYIDNASAINNTNKYLKYINEHIEIETKKEQKNIKNLHYYVSENKKTTDLLKSITGKEVFLLASTELASVLAIIKKEDKDNIYEKVFKMLTEENIAENLTERSAIRGQYLFYLQFKNDSNRKVVDEAFDIIKKYEITNPVSYNLMLQSIISHNKKNPNIEVLRRHNFEHSQTPLVDRQTSPYKGKGKKMRFLEQKPCETDANCVKDIEKCIKKLCITTESISPSDIYIEGEEKRVLYGRKKSTYPTSVSKKRDNDTNKLI